MVKAKKQETEKQIATVDTVNTECVTGEVMTAAFSEEAVKAYEAMRKEIVKQIRVSNNANLSVVLMLHTIFRRKLYQVGNYNSVSDMADKEFGISQTKCNNYIHVCERFCEYDEKQDVYTGLKQEYKDYLVSQLIELLPVPTDLLKEMNKDMSVREIRRKKEIYKRRQALIDKGIDPDKIETQDFSKKKNGKRKTVELICADNVMCLSDIEQSELQEKMREFETKNPDIPYKFSISVIYTPEKSR